MRRTEDISREKTSVQDREREESQRQAGLGWAFKRPSSYCPAVVEQAFEHAPRLSLGTHPIKLERHRSCVVNKDIITIRFFIEKP